MRQSTAEAAAKTKAAATPAKTAPADKAPATGSKETDSGRPRLSYAEQRERDKVVRRARKKVEEAEAEVARLEQAVKDIETALSSGASDDPEIYNRHAEATKQLENAMSMWELASMELDELTANG